MQTEVRVYIMGAFLIHNRQHEQHRMVGVSASRKLLNIPLAIAPQRLSHPHIVEGLSRVIDKAF